LEEAIDECGIQAPSEIWRLIDGDMDPELSAVLLCLNGCDKSMLHEQLRRLRQELDIRKSALCTNTVVQVPISTAVDSGSTFGNIQSVLEARNIQSVSEATNIQSGCEVPETFTTGHEVPANSTNGSCEFPNTSTTGRSPKTSTTGQGVPENSTKAGSEFPKTSSTDIVVPIFVPKLVGSVIIPTFNPQSTILGQQPDYFGCRLVSVWTHLLQWWLMRRAKFKLLHATM